MASWNTGEKNGFWKGGRSIASNGYVLIRVGTNHHLADIRGYAYEHRLVAEEKIGRRLLPGEQVHHINGDKADNRPENLEIVASAAHHQLRHRHRTDLRLPDEENVLVECLCGCGSTFTKFDSTGRPRQYVSGHNPPLSPTMDKIIALLSDSPRRLSDMREHFPSVHVLKTVLSRMKKKGLVRNIDRGVWELQMLVDGEKVSLPALDGVVWNQFPEGA